MRAHQSLEKNIMLGITGGARKKWKPRMRWMDDIKNVTGLSVNDLNQLAEDRKKWIVEMLALLISLYFSGFLKEPRYWQATRPTGVLLTMSTS